MTQSGRWRRCVVFSFPTLIAWSRPCESLGIFGTRTTIAQKHTALFWSHHIEGAEHANGSTNGRQYNLSSPREWLEWQENINGIPGAYTVLRCDLFAQESNRWKIWGKDFHMERLQGSCASLLSRETSAPEFDEMISDALKESLNVFERLLEVSQDTFQADRSNEDELSSQSFVVFMVTLLWSPKGETIRVSGHVFSDEKPVTPGLQIPTPIVASLAIDPRCQLPQRFDANPSSKISSWCRNRRLLEESFKVEGASEVILTKQNDLSEGSTIMLEGLTSNVFVLYEGGEIRTASDSLVLGGYARTLVIDACRACGIEVDEIAPIRVDESLQWKEVFVTSSIKLITPVKEILLPCRTNDGSIEMQQLWHTNQVQTGTSAFQKIYKCLFV